MLEKLPKASLDYKQLMQAYSSAFKMIWEIMTAFAALGRIAPKLRCRPLFARSKV